VFLIAEIFHGLENRVYFAPGWEICSDAGSTSVFAPGIFWSNGNLQKKCL